MKNYIMKSLGLLTTAVILLFAAQGCYSQNTSSQKKPAMDSSNNKKNPVYSNTDTNKVVLTDDEWKKMLSPEVYNVARQKGTERPYTSAYEAFKEVGTYYCAVCGNALFRSDTKFESGCGWPSFYQPISKGSIIYAQDNTYGMSRTEVMCGRCKSHLGHVFDDGPPPTGLRYCINGVVLDFKKAQEIEKNYNEQEKKQ
ncbi:peptide-methionine (R)-S-oxide reductase MsrB [Panacibacter ginsenosidivorans]|uniref:Peptide methionine sulfoxide reductase MsrB n=1 Tax=Panacibacter ginsenosidivorans TaxID=1813871 RepID=A0A5B8V9D9_9BACT|nr:peptide-methionine (R)-S-oxide reductase MsrB [Panacibacter ginsenosidivorans]QEC67942.1 peptide-methionine (R)-S-oxide reductase MsrB [Panacibacter ginsenosidivorans]